MERYRSNLKELRIRRNMTIDQFSEKTGVAPRALLGIESEKGSNPQLATIRRLIQYLEITLDELYPEP